MTLIGRVCIAVAIGLANLIGQFLSWSFATGNIARPMSLSGFASLVYAVTSFPLATFFKGGYNSFFWLLTVANAVVWGLVGLWAVKVLK